MALQDIFDAEVAKHQIVICRSCEGDSHRRAAASIDGSRVVHMAAAITNRKSLFTGLHEIGHIVANKPGMRRWEQEATATEWAKEAMRAHGVPIPRGVLGKYDRYIKRWRRFGNKVSRALKLRNRQEANR